LDHPVDDPPHGWCIERVLGGASTETLEEPTTAT